MRVLVGLIEHLGDIVACEPVARYLKLQRPEAHLTWAVSDRYRELIDANPHIDETLIIDCLTDWIKLTKHNSYDRVVDLHVNYRVCEHCRIPLIKSSGNPFVSAYEWFDYGTLLEAFTLGAGLPVLSAEARIYLREEHVSAVDDLNLPAEYCVVHRESNTAAKDWEPERWHAVCHAIKDELKLELVDVGAGAVAPAPPPEGTINLFNRLSILQTAEVIRRARLFVGVDSGPAHLANAVRTPGVVLLGRHGYFKKYMPFNGFFASDAPQVKMVRNLSGLVRDLTPKEVVEAVRYVAASSVARRPTPLAAGQRLPAPPATARNCGKEHAKDRKMLESSGLFDAAWYGVHYPDAVESGLALSDHYLTVGRAEKRSPGPGFDLTRYLQAYPDIAASGLDPLSHYLRHGKKEGRSPLPNGPTETSAPPRPDRVFDGVVDNATIAAATGAKSGIQYPRTFAFYLPQFHPIAENDWAHGAGFSEWHNVLGANPLFKGHYQPRIPGELGFYDLRSPEVLKEQIALARMHGITGFCFYYYYFAGKKLLHTPLNNYLVSKIDAPFFLLWANENWSRLWDGGDRQVIIQQQHSCEDDLAFIRELVPVFADDRYVKIGSKPLLLIYKAHLFPDILHTTDIWREEVEKHGFAGLYLVMVDDWTNDLNHPRDFGFDATYEIPSNIIPEQVLYEDAADLGLPETFVGRIVDYAKFAEFHLARPLPVYKRFRTVMLPWDNTPRYGSRAIVHINGRGESYKTWLLEALLDTYRVRAPEERIVFLHSWNEWCEGTYLEPDQKFGRAFLEQTREVIALANTAIDIWQGPVDELGAVTNLLKVLHAKDEAAIRNAQAAVSIGRELDAARHEVDQLRHERDAIYRSASWKVARRLRAMAQRARFVRRLAGI